MLWPRTAHGRHGQEGEGARKQEEAAQGRGHPGRGSCWSSHPVIEGGKEGNGWVVCKGVGYAWLASPLILLLDNFSSSYEGYEVRRGLPRCRNLGSIAHHDPRKLRSARPRSPLASFSGFSPWVFLFLPPLSSLHTRHIFPVGVGRHTATRAHGHTPGPSVAAAPWHFFHSSLPTRLTPTPHRTRNTGTEAHFFQGTTASPRANPEP